MSGPTSITDQILANAFVPYTDSRPLLGSRFQGVLIMNKILSLLIAMTASLQNAASATVDRLNFETEWQSEYTNVINQLHTFVRNNGDLIQGSGTTASNIRDDLNRANSTYTQNLQANRSIVQDDSKKIQSFLQQLNDSVSQQTNLGSAILNQISTILGSMFH